MKNKMKFTTKQITVHAIGMALYVVVGCLVPIRIPNSQAFIDLGYTIMTVYAYIFGPVAGLLIGAIGRILVDVTMYGGLGTPGWLIASALIGYLGGFILKKGSKMGSFVKELFFRVCVCL